MSELTTIANSLADKQLLGAALGDPSSWTTWRSVMKAAYAESLTAAEREAFDHVAGGRAPPTRKVRELAVVVSRRGGKGRVAGALATYESALVDHAPRLAPGEVGIVACISPTRAQSQIVKDYTLGYFQASPVLRGEIAEVTGDEIRLRNGNLICTLASDYRTLRGRTLLLAILDEASFLRDETSTTPDIEAARALLPGLSTTNGMLVILSSPYRQVGLLHQRYRDYFGKDSNEVLCVAGSSLAFNPTLDEKMIAEASAADPQAAMSEWHGAFRTDLAQFLDDASIDAAIDHYRPLELPPREATRYFCFVDMSGGRHDSSAVAITHAEGTGDARLLVCDVIRGRKGSPAAAAREFADLAKQYRCHPITGDSYAADWVSATYRELGRQYMKSELTRSEIYLECLPSFTRGMVRIPDQPTLVRELRLLQRRTARSGKDSVDHGVGGSDDLANALCGALYLISKAASRLAAISLDAWTRILSDIRKMPPRRLPGFRRIPVSSPLIRETKPCARCLSA
jgi:hypothetical protein